MFSSLSSERLRQLCLWSVTFLLLCIAGIKFLRQDITLRKNQPNDLRNVYFGARAWVKGEQPYDPNVLLREMKAADTTTYRLGLHSGSIVNCVYPPTCLMLIAPLTALSWNWAVDLELALCVIAYLWLTLEFTRRLPSGRRIYFAAFILAFAPFHGAFQLGNISAFAIPLMLLAILFIDDYPIAAAFLLAIAACLKPQTGAFFCFHLLLSRRWRSFAIATATGTVLSAIAVVRMSVAGIRWIQPYHDIVALQLSPFGSNENAILQNGHLNLTLFNLQPIAYSILHDRATSILAAYIAFAIAFSLYLGYMLVRYHRNDSETDLLLWAFVAIVSFLPLYQRYYNTISLLLLFFWAVKFWPGTLAKVVTVCSMIFILPVSKFALVAGMVTGGELRASALLENGKALANLSTPQMVALAIPYLFVLTAIPVLLTRLWMTQQSAVNDVSMTQEERVAVTR